ncbi:hypothetical protein [Pseudoxanthomonas daejeonensis]|uniref:hypothetical protein n=1 Tax=Pseudoxanthomonas daejeonensis TaxID=266062 RepID=UPI00139171CF|nr:hypothetical protein [Pseudoxanthomonas daejeonensis]
MNRACALLGRCLCILVVVLAADAVAGPTAPAPDAGAAGAQRVHATGDAWLDGRLADIDLYAERYPDAFAAELERYAGVPRAYVSGLLAQPGWHGGDAWFACFLAHATEATCRSVVRARTRAGAETTWEAVAAEFDARPGSPAYGQLRLSLADSYRRWSRPLQPDPALTRALRKRAEAETKAGR